MDRVITYIDGFNLYFGLKSKKWRRYYWQNLQILGQNLLKSEQSLIFTKYFTAIVTFPPDKAKRQKTFIEALESLNNLSIYYGKYQINTRKCVKCGNIAPIPNEKMTDVNIAVELLSDAYQNKFDTAILISADSDLTAPINTVLKLFPAKRIICAFPPDRYSFELSRTASGYFTIGRKKFAESTFPDEVTNRDGFKLVKPESWK